MPPAVATPNVLGEFQEDTKGVAGVAWGHRVNGNDQMVVATSRNSGLQGPGTTAQRIMKANGIKLPKKPPPLSVPPTPPQAPPSPPRPPPAAAAVAPAAGPAAAANGGPAVGVPAAMPAPSGGPAIGTAVGIGSFTLLGSSSGKQRPPKLAAVIEEPGARGCCFGFFRGAVARPTASSPRPGPANDPLPAGNDPPVVTGPRALTASISGRGAPSVMTSSFRHANQSIKRVPQSARSRGASARSQRGASAGARSDMSNWDDVSDSEFQELEDFIDDDNDSIARDYSETSLQAASSFSSHGRVPSGATSTAIAAYRESTAGNKAAPKSILKSAKRESKQVVIAYAADGPAGPQNELAGRSRVMLADGLPDDDGSGAAPAATGMPTYGAATPPGYHSNSLGPTSFRPSPFATPSHILAATASGSGPDTGAGGAVAGSVGPGGDCQLSVAQSGGSVPGAPPRAGGPSIKLTAEELLGLLMAQGKLTEHDVQELGLAGVESHKGSPGQQASSPNSRSPSRFGSNGGGASPVPYAGAAMPLGATQSAGNSASRLHPAEAGIGGTWSPPGPQPFLSQLRGADTNTSMQRVRFSASQVPVGGEGPTGSPVLAISASHRVRFGDDEFQPVAAAAAAAAAAVAVEAAASAAPAVAAANGGGRVSLTGRTQPEPARGTPAGAPNAASASARTPSPPGAAARHSSAPTATTTAPSASASAASSGLQARQAPHAGAGPTWHATAAPPAASGTGGATSGGDGSNRGNPVPVAEDSEVSKVLVLRPPASQVPAPGKGALAAYDVPVGGTAAQPGQPQQSQPTRAPGAGQAQGQGQGQGQQGGRDTRESLDLEEMLNATVLRLDTQPQVPSSAPVRLSITGATPSPPATAAATASRSPRPHTLTHTEALRLGPPGAYATAPSDSLASVTSPIIPAGLAAYRGGPMLRSSDSGVMRSGGAAPAPGGPIGVSPKHSQVLRLSGGPHAAGSPNEPSRPGSAGSNTSVTGYSHWGPTGGSGTSGGGGVSVTAPGAAAGNPGGGGAGGGGGGGADGGGGGRAMVGGSAGGIGGGGLGAVDRLAMRKLQSHLSRGNASSRHTVSSAGDSMSSQSGPPLRQPSRSNWIYSTSGSSQAQNGDQESDEGPGTPERDAADTRYPSSQAHLLARPSVRSVRFTAPVIFELQQSGDFETGNGSGADAGGAGHHQHHHNHHNHQQRHHHRHGRGGGGGGGRPAHLPHGGDDEDGGDGDGVDEEERDAVAAAAAAAARSRSLRMRQEYDALAAVAEADGDRAELMYQPTANGPGALDASGGNDRAGAWV